MPSSLRTKILLIAVAIAVAFSGLLGTLAYLEHRVDSTAASALAHGAVARRLESDLERRAHHVARTAAIRVSPSLAAGDTAATAAIGRRLLDRTGVTAVTIRDGRGRVAFVAARRGSTAATGSTYTAVAPVLATLGSGRGRIGTLEISFSRADSERTLADLRLQIARNELLQGKRFAAGLLGLGALMLLAGIGGAWLFADSLARPISQLARSAERIGQGDYSNPLPVRRNDEIGDLQATLERMRLTLSETTVTKNHLNTVLDSLSDAVFVTAPDGLIRSCNEATCRLLGRTEPELRGTPLLDLVDAAHRSAFDPTPSGGEARETVLRTASGQTIPVSMAGSTISSADPQFQGNIYVARNITERKRAERRIRYLARYDTLTKMPNRMQFQHMLQQAIARSRRNQRSLALLYLDLDRFKDVNDTFGHAAGDRTLEILSERLARALSKDIVIGRLAGDEFAMFVDDLPPDVDHRAAIGAIARKLLDEISRAFYVNHQEVYLTASVGIAICPTDAENVIDLIRNADAAMYHSKQNGGNSCAFYVPAMNAAAVERLMLKSKLRRALEREEFLILYQPKVDLRTERIVGAEALLRWRLPGHGDISPSLFIPLAEETHLILDIGDWVLNRVCLDYARWQVRLPTPGRIAVNLSLRQLKHAGFVARARSIFREHQVSPTRFELEVTETTLMTDPKRTIGLLNELHAMGLHLAIDDFGTGYSSLSALQQFPIGTLKIDQSFVRGVASDADAAAIVRTIIDMGKSLELEVVAEGVELPEQLAFLRERGCEFAQGRLFGDAMSGPEFLALLERQERGATALGGTTRPTANRRPLQAS
ncbi:MAG: EAL domain-containing protein [Gammaproteobacteria bacterium]|nr:EAL domain-containing protein [Gammaproteobacteria bacterium]